MAATPSIKIEKTMPYRGGTKLYSNRYHFNGGTPSTLAHWKTLADNIIADEKIMYGSGVTIVSAVYYAAGSDLPLGSDSYSVAGTMSTTGASLTPGDCAVQLRYATDQRSVKNHPIYLWNWIHPAYKAASDPGDNLLTLQHTHVEDVAAAWIAGYSDGVNTYVRAGPRGAAALGYLVSPYIKHRDFPA
jgi:hypothetical protein